jgi:hypothetical protein
MNRSGLPPPGARNDALRNDDDNKGTFGATHRGSIACASLTGFFLLLISSAGLLVMRLAASTSATLFPHLISTMRTAPVPPAPVTDGLPAAALVLQTSYDVTLCLFFTSLIAALAFGALRFITEADSAEAYRGSSAYLWFAMLVPQVLILGQMALLSGVTDALALVFAVGLVAAWIGTFWWSNLLTTPAYLEQLAASGTGFTWVPLAFAVLQHAFFYVPVYVSLGFLHSGANAPSSLLLVGPLVGTLLYLVQALIEALRVFGWALRGNYEHHIALYVFNIAYLLVVPWATVLSFTGDNITPI